MTLHGPQTGDVLIAGAGGHARVVADIIERVGGLSIRGFLDDRPGLLGADICWGLRVVGGTRDLLRAPDPGCSLIVAIGGNRRREEIALMARAHGWEFASAVHPAAHTGRGAEIGPGTVVMANAVINPGARVGAHVIINTSATVDHDCVVEDFSHLSPGVNLAGGVRVGRGAHMGINSCAIPGVGIGEWTVVGAGATVVRTLPANITAAGTPAAQVVTARNGARA